MTQKEKANNLYSIAVIYITLIGVLFVLRTGVLRELFSYDTFTKTVNSFEYLLLVVFFAALFSLREIQSTRATRTLYNIIIFLEAITLTLHSLNFALRMLSLFDVVNSAVVDLIFADYLVKAIIEFSPIITLYVPTLFLAAILIIELYDVNYMLLGVTISNIIWIVFYKIIPSNFLSYGPVIGRIIRSYYFGYFLEILWAVGAILMVVEERKLGSREMVKERKTAV